MGRPGLEPEMQLSHGFTVRCDTNSAHRPLMTPAGFEPDISWLRTRNPEPLDEGAKFNNTLEPALSNTPCRQVRELRSLTVAAFAVCIQDICHPIVSILTSAVICLVCAWLNVTRKKPPASEKSETGGCLTIFLTLSAL